MRRKDPILLENENNDSVKKAESVKPKYKLPLIGDKAKAFKL